MEHLGAHPSFSPPLKRIVKRLFSTTPYFQTKFSPGTTPIQYTGSKNVPSGLTYLICKKIVGPKISQYPNEFRKPVAMTLSVKLPGVLHCLRPRNDTRKPRCVDKNLPKTTYRGRSLYLQRIRYANFTRRAQPDSHVGNVVIRVVTMTTALAAVFRYTD